MKTFKEFLDSNPDVPEISNTAKGHDLSFDAKTGSELFCAKLAYVAGTVDRLGGDGMRSDPRDLRFYFQESQNLLAELIACVDIYLDDPDRGIGADLITR